MNVRVLSHIFSYFILTKLQLDEKLLNRWWLIYEAFRLTKVPFRIKFTPQAEVAELADALGSGLSGRKVVRVQVPPSAPKWTHFLVCPFLLAYRFVCMQKADGTGFQR